METGYGGLSMNPKKLSAKWCAWMWDFFGIVFVMLSKGPMLLKMAKLLMWRLCGREQQDGKKQEQRQALFILHQERHIWRFIGIYKYLPSDNKCLVGERGQLVIPYYSPLKWSVCQNTVWGRHSSALLDSNLSQEGLLKFIFSFILLKSDWLTVLY